MEEEREGGERTDSRLLREAYSSSKPSFSSSESMISVACETGRMATDRGGSGRWSAFEGWW